MFLGAATSLVVAGTAVLMVNVLLLSSLSAEPYQACTPSTSCTSVPDAVNSFHAAVLVNEIAGATLMALGVLVLVIGVVRARRVP